MIHSLFNDYRRFRRDNRCAVGRDVHGERGFVVEAAGVGHAQGEAGVGSRTGSAHVRSDVAGTSTRWSETVTPFTVVLPLTVTVKGSADPRNG